VSRWKNLDPDYQDHKADQRCIDCDRHLGLGSRGDLCAICNEKREAEMAYEPDDPKNPRWWK
jgi:hypothetical protein